MHGDACCCVLLIGKTLGNAGVHVYRVTQFQNVAHVAVYPTPPGCVVPASALSRAAANGQSGLPDLAAIWARQTGQKNIMNLLAIRPCFLRKCCMLWRILTSAHSDSEGEKISGACPLW